MSELKTLRLVLSSDVTPGAYLPADSPAGHQARLQPNATGHTAVAPGANLRKMFLETSFESTNVKLLLDMHLLLTTSPHLIFA